MNSEIIHKSQQKRLSGWRTAFVYREVMQWPVLFIYMSTAITCTAGAVAGAGLAVGTADALDTLLLFPADV